MATSEVTSFKRNFSRIANTSEAEAIILVNGKAECLFATGKDKTEKKETFSLKSVQPHFQTPRSSSKILYCHHIFKSFLIVWNCGQTQLCVRYFIKIHTLGFPVKKQNTQPRPMTTFSHSGNMSKIKTP